MVQLRVEHVPRPQRRSSTTTAATTAWDGSQAGTGCAGKSLAIPRAATAATAGSNSSSSSSSSIIIVGIFHLLGLFSRYVLSASGQRFGR
jgi:hypothetical protein